MNDASTCLAQLYALADVQCEGTLTAVQMSQLEELVIGSEELRHHYILHTNINALAEIGRCGLASELDLPRTNAVELPVEHYSCGDSLSPSPAIVPSFLTTAIPGTVGYFSEGMPLAYLLATVIVGVGLLIGSRIYMSSPEQLAQQSVPLPSPPSTTHYPLPTTHSTVGRITGMVDCCWAEVGWVERSATPPEGGRQGEKDSVAENQKSKIQNPKSLVALGDRFALTSGLLEITYDTGAKVILQGPVTYEVESNGGYLAVGKLTGKLEKGSEVRVQESEASNHKSEILNHKFVVRTPTATVTDLGTEFGVEVDKAGTTQSHVFRGSVRVQLLGGDGNAEGPGQVLHENESARAERRGGLQSHLILSRVSSSPKTFIRHIQPVAIPLKFIDLLDIVAGGNGVANGRERGIDPFTSMEDPTFIAGRRACDGRYHAAETYNLKLIDGVFTVGATGGPVQIDSAGHTFSGFPKNDGYTTGSIWARAASVRPQDRVLGDGNWNNWVYKFHPTLDKKLAPEGRGLLGIHANAGITFDLEAIHRLWGRKVTRFCATLGKDCNTLADAWVFVDGRLELRQTLKPVETHWSGATPVDVAIGPTDRFLTLTTTDGGDGSNLDWVVFGDPVLQLASDDAEKEN